MKQLPLLTSFLVIAVSSLSVGNPEPQGPTKSEFQSRYDVLTKAYLNRDVPTVSRYIAPDYAAGDNRRPMDKQKTLDALKKWDGRFKTTSRKVLNVIVNGKKATAMTALVTQGKITDGKGDHKYVINARCMDTWVHNSAGWQLKHSQLIHSTLTRDGKSVPSKNPFAR